MPQTKRLPAPWAAQVRRSLRSLLHSEARALAHLRSIAKDSIGHPQTPDEARKAAQSIQVQIERAIIEIRQDARLAAEQQFLEELELAGIESPDLSYADDEDTARAAAVSRSYAAALLFAMLLLLRQGRDPKRSVDLEDYRLRRIAATEVAQAYGTSHEMFSLGVTNPEWGRRWDATLDMKTCQACYRHHGEIVALGESFSDGDVPGDMHPQCRCVPTLIPLALRVAA